MRRTAVVGSTLAIAMLAAGCQDRMMITEPGTPELTTASSFNLQSSSLTIIHLDRDQVRLPFSIQLTHQSAPDIARRAINGDDYVCGPEGTAVTNWLLGHAYEVFDAEPEIYRLLFVNLLADQALAYSAVLFESDETPQHFGSNGEYTKIMEKTDRDIRRFWDIESDDLQLIALHGPMVLDTQRIAATYQLVFGVPATFAPIYAAMVRDAVLASETLNGGDHPLFTFNAFASTNGKIAMGDGMLAGYEALGFEDVAPQAVFAHEFAHQVQFHNGYNVDDFSSELVGAEKTRYMELMADAMAAYFLTHKRGATMNQKRVEQFLEAFYQIGDCSFSHPGHHGTPNQRMAAAQWGFALADEAHKQGHILSSQEVYARFLEVYPEIIAPDAN
ncbi:MAG TPA: hypothetical protein VHG09_05170 [Longimicrobiales bacterium]|nr:hypothetical protein [Longimicrobiales bacterium]